MDHQLRAAERALHQTPNLGSLAAYLTIRLRKGVTPADYDELIETLQMVPEFGRNNWPWYTYHTDAYSEAKHRDILQMIVRIYPLHSILDRLKSRWTVQDLCNLLSVLRSRLAEGQINLVPVDAFYYGYDSDYEPSYEDVVSYVKRNGLIEFPEALVVEEDDGSSLMCSIITVVDNFDPPAGTRYNICLHGQWMYEGSPGSTTFIPYREYCETHKQDLDQCSCLACGMAEHPCNCEVCENVFIRDPDNPFHPFEYDGCGKYHNRDNEFNKIHGIIPDHLRCQCYDLCPECGNFKVACDC